MQNIQQLQMVIRNLKVRICVLEFTERPATTTATTKMVATRKAVATVKKPDNKQKVPITLRVFTVKSSSKKSLNMKGELNENHFQNNICKENTSGITIKVTNFDSK